jgi:hypothetical protein
MKIKIVLSAVLIILLISCEKSRPKTDKPRKECTNLPLVHFSEKITKSVLDSLLLHQVMCELPSIILDSPCCNRQSLMSSIDRNYRTNLSGRVIYGCDIDLFTDSTRDLYHFHKILELKFNNANEAFENTHLLSIAPKDKPAFKTENKGTLAWRLKSFAKDNKLYLVFSNIESNFDELLKAKLDSILSLNIKK